MDGLDAEGLLVQGPPSVVRIGNDTQSKRKGLHAREAISGSDHVDTNKLRTPKSYRGQAGTQRTKDQSRSRSSGQKVSISRAHSCY